MKGILIVVFYCLWLVTVNGQKQEHKQEFVIKAVEPGYDKVSGIHRFFFGESYRKLWAAPVRMRVINLATEKGGLTPYEKGGGLQTKSLKLKDRDGRDWALRSIQKYPEKGLPKKLRATIAKDILQDQVVTGHPYAALTVPVFADAVGLYHSNPEVVYVPDDPALGIYRKEFANSVLLLEERDPIGTKNTLKTDALQEKLETDSKERVDQRIMLRARLLDHLLGDWDRHEEQWRWQKKDKGSNAVYVPIARDRDKVFYSPSGVLPFVLSWEPSKANLQGFKNDIRHIPKYNYNNRYFDRYFLNELTQTDWENEITFVTSKITDAVIDAALKRLPDTIYRLSAAKLSKSLKARRNNLRKDALEYYQFLSRNVDIPATNSSDYLGVEMLDNGRVAVELSTAGKDREKGEAYYKRIFDPNVTKEVRLYALNGKDNFSVSGSTKSPIKIRMIGGRGDDVFSIDSSTNNRKKFYVYDSTGEKNILPSANLARIRTKGDTAVNYFNRRSFKFDTHLAVASLFFSLDQGVLFGVGYNYEKQGFRKEPFAEKHRFTGGYSTARSSLAFTYSGHFTKVLKKNDLRLNFISRGPRNASNFFGIGNETVFENAGNKKIDYYRNRFDIVTGDIRVVRQLNRGLTVSAGPAILWYGSTTKNNDTRFFKSFNDINPEQKVFDNRFYTGAVAAVDIDTRNNPSLPSLGLLWNTELRGMRDVSGSKTSYGAILSELNFYLPFFSDSTIVLANRVGAGTTVGQPTFFQQMQLGGGDNLRGFHRSRFTGKSVFYHNIDLRTKLFDFNSYLFPGTVGLIAFNDVGRVWVPNESSEKWHHGYGGGFYIVPAELVLVQAIVGHSEEGYFPYISIGFSF